MMTPEKKKLAIRLGVPLSVLLVALLFHAVHRSHRGAPQGAPQDPAPGNASAPGASALTSAGNGGGTPSGSGSGGGAESKSREGGASSGSPRVAGAQVGGPQAGGASGAGETGGVPAKAPVETCFTVTFHHKELASHSNEEACSRHRNLIRLKHANINAASVCVRVNGTPVKFQRVQGRSDELLIGAIAGPQAKITARFCVGKNRCDEDCTIPKDEFMDAIGGSDNDDSGAPSVAQWDANDAAEKETAEATAKLDSELKRELASDDEGGKGDGTYVFRDWLSEPEAPIACGTRQARN